MMTQRSFPLASCRFRPALPRDRHQVRRLLHSDDQRAAWQLLGAGFSCGVLLALGLHWLLAIGGLQLLGWGIAGIGALTIGTWLDRQLLSDWQNYWVIEQNNRLIACGKVTCYRTYAVLSDVVVSPEHRQQGIGSFLVKSFIQQTKNPLYLACFPNRVRFYQRLNFAPVDARSLSAHLRRSLELDLEPNLIALVHAALETAQPEKTAS
jgi:N-acetylglutamate synthase-like GNAT family acetyltransferase